MDPLLGALLDFGGNVVGGITSYFTADRQARAYEHATDAQRDVGLAWMDALETWYNNVTDIAGLNALLGQTQAREGASVERAKLYFLFKTAEAMRGAVIAVAGVGLVATALYLAAKEEA